MKVVDWFRDAAVRKVARFGVPVALGKLAASFAGLLTLAMLARHLGPKPLGVIAVIRTVVAMVEQYANFNTWQAIVKYGTEAIADDRRVDVGKIIKLSIAIDIVTAIAASVFLSIFALATPSTFGWNSHEAFLCGVYALTILTRVAGASDGIFRICDAYRSQAISSAISAVIMTAIVGVAILMNASFDGCVIALIVGEIVGNLVITTTSLWIAKISGFGDWYRVPLKGARSTFPGIVRFLVSTNAQLTVKKTNAEVDMFIVGVVLGQTDAGLFRVVKQVATIPGRVFMPFEQVLFTELARAIANADFVGFRRLLRRFAAIVGGGSLLIWLVTALAAGLVIRIIAGPAFLDAVPAFRWYLLAMVLGVANAPVLRAMIALGRPGTLFLFDLATLFVLVAAAIVGAYAWGIVGVSVAVLFHRVLQLIWSTWLVDRTLKERALSSARDKSSASSSTLPADRRVQ